VTVSATANLPHSDQRSQARPALRAQVGDTLIAGEGVGVTSARRGVIIAVTNADGSPPYRVRWLAGEYESLVFPGPGARVEKGH